MNFPQPLPRVFIQEVALRDGLQIEPRWMETADKIELIDALSAVGFAKIEVSSFVSPKAVPMLRDASEVFAAIRRNPSVTYVALVPNMRGAEAAMAAEVDEINLVMSSSETHNRGNMRMSCAESLSGFRRIVETLVGTPIAVNGSVATAFGCPFDGAQPVDRVLGIVEQYLEAGIQSITLADTTGMANPRQVAEMAERCRDRFSDTPLTFHFHDTRGMGLANILAAYQHGVERFDASLGGLGGCPFAPGATGNVCTEDMVHMFGTMGVETGVDLAALLMISARLPGLVGHDVPGRVVKAGPSSRRYPAPRE